MFAPKYDRFRSSPWASWDDDDDEEGGPTQRSIRDAIMIACAPVLLSFSLEAFAEWRRRRDALEHPELYDIEDDE